MIDFQSDGQRERRPLSPAPVARARRHALGLGADDGVAVSGDVVNLCARVASSAEPGEIRLTPQVFRELGPADRLICHALGSVVLKGVARR